MNVKPFIIDSTCAPAHCGYIRRESSSLCSWNVKLPITESHTETDGDGHPKFILFASDGPKTLVGQKEREIIGKSGQGKRKDSGLDKVPYLLTGLWSV